VVTFAVTVLNMFNAPDIVFPYPSIYGYINLQITLE